MAHKGLILILSTLVHILISGCGDKIEPGNTIPDGKGVVKTLVSTAQVTEEVVFHEAVGTIKARSATIVSSKLMGTVKAIMVKEGDRFSKGDILIHLDPRQVSAQLRQAKAALDEARQGQTAAVSSRNAAGAGAQLAEATYERYLQLMEEDSASQQEFDEITSGHLQAKASLVQAEAMVTVAASRVKQAEAGVAAVDVNRQDATIRAPYDGWVGAKLIDEGNLAAPGTPLLSLEGAGGYRINAVVPEKHIQAIAPNQTLRVTIDALKGEVIEGTVFAVSPAADIRSHTFLAKISIPERESILSGMFARISIPVAQSRKIVIPSSAVIHQGQLTGLFLVDDTQTARFRLIRTGRTIDRMVEVLSGLNEGDRYVPSPTVRLVDGAQVEDAQ